VIATDVSSTGWGVEHLVRKGERAAQELLAPLLAKCSAKGKKEILTHLKMDSVM